MAETTLTIHSMTLMLLTMYNTISGESRLTNRRLFQTFGKGVLKKMMNFQKIGYSTREVAQILGCTPTTVVSYIDKGKLEALKSENEKKSQRKRIFRITREQLAKYLNENKERYPKELVSQFVKEQIYKDTDSWIPDNAYKANDISELQGAFKTESDILNPSKFSIIIDDRICVGNISLKTAHTIFNALIEDESFSYNKTITLKKE